jgi:CHAD domain-containing protein
VPVRDYAFEQMNRLLTTLAFRVHQAAKTPGADEIHDLRVSIRRFSQGLRVFGDFFPKRELKKIKKLLKRMMRLTSELRNRDITLEYLAEMKHATHQHRLEQERTDLAREFSEMIRRWSARDFSAKWRSDLSLRSI